MRRYRCKRCGRKFTTRLEGVVKPNDQYAVLVKEYVNADSMLRLKDAEHVVAIKWTVPEGEDYDDMTRFSHIF
ncbi:MAG: hypothetical protein ACE5PT_02170, partial [Gemmatimonadales bacterium]